MKKVIFAILISMAQLLFGTNIFAKTVTVYGLEAMPFCGTVDKQVTGIAIEILNEATKYGAPSFVFDLNIPWKRAQYNLEKATANDLVAIIPFSRTEAREGNFKWVAELIKTQYRLYSYGRISPIKSIDEVNYHRQRRWLGLLHLEGALLLINQTSCLESHLLLDLYDVAI